MTKKIFVTAMGLGLVFIAVSCNTNPPTAPAADTAAAAAPAVKAEPAPKDLTGYLLGVWYDEAIKTPQGAKIAYQVISSGKRVYIQAVTFKGKNFKVSDTPAISPSATELRKSGDRYVSIESPEESYEVDKAGNLLIYDHEGLVATCKKIL